MKVTVPPLVQIPARLAGNRREAGWKVSLVLLLELFRQLLAALQRELCFFCFSLVLRDKKKA